MVLMITQNKLLKIASNQQALKKIIVFLMVSFLLALSNRAQTNGTKTEEVNIPGSTLKIKMVSIQGGSFMMGDNKASKLDEKPAKQVTVSDFWIGAFEITHDQFDVFFKDDQTTQGSKSDAVTRPTA
jgi:formylglycine-generating enzyme required for sulfatase activity